MRNPHAYLSVVILSAALLATPAAAAEPSAAGTADRETGVGRVIAEQGNQALLQIRQELRTLLHGQPPQSVPAAERLSRLSPQVLAAAGPRI